MKIYDCITFFNELDLLEMRMEILNDYVDFFVINEATITFQNNPKPLYYLENKDRFKKFEHKIIHNIVDDTPTTNSHWDNDIYHKDCTMRALQNCDDSDIIIYSDADEIPNPVILKDVIENRFQNDRLFLFHFDLYCYFLDTKVPGQLWKGTRLSNWGYLKQYSINLFRAYGDVYWQNYSDEVIDVLPSQYGGVMTGWHYTWMGGPEKAKLKLESFGHVEYNNDYMKSSMDAKIKNLEDVISRPGWNPEKIVLDSTNTSEYLLNNIVKYRQHIFNFQNLCNSKEVQRLLSEPRMGPATFMYGNENRLPGLLEFIEHHNLSDKSIVEIGCYLGISTELFAIFCKNVFSIDLWGIDELYDGGENAKEAWPSIYQSAQDRLFPYSNVKLIRDFGDKASESFENNSLDLIYLDGNHSYESVKSDFKIWYEKLKIGGIMSGHDYNQKDVKSAVDEMVDFYSMAEFMVFSDTSWSAKK